MLPLLDFYRKLMLLVSLSTSPLLPPINVRSREMHVWDQASPFLAKVAGYINKDLAEGWRRSCHIGGRVLIH
jgi:hypothetical protein